MHCSEQPPIYAYAQKLNNSAALCIEVGAYDRAIASLQRALRLSELYMNDKIKTTTTAASSAGQTSGTACSCQECTLDGFIIFSESNNIPVSSISSSSRRRRRSIDATVIATETETANANANANATIVVTDHNSSNRSNKRRRIEVAVIAAPNNNDGDTAFCNKESSKRSKNNNDDDNNDDSDSVLLDENNTNNKDDSSSSSSSNEDAVTENNYCYIYKRPIRVHRHCHEMGSILFLVILFNLALSHHLKAATIITTINNNNNNNNNTHTHNTHIRGKNEKNHRAALAKSIHKAQLLYELVFEYWSRLQKREQCSIRFNMILHNNLSQMYRLVNNPIKERQCLQNLLSTVMMFVTDCNNKTRNNNNHQHYHHQQTYNTGSSSSSSSSSSDLDLDGFLTNTAALTIHERCAKAA